MTTTPQKDLPSEHWTSVITPHGSVFHIPSRELLECRDLIYRFVLRDFVSRYKQTIFGSPWYVLQPLFTSLMFTLVSNKIAKISTGDIPPCSSFSLAKCAGVISKVASHKWLPHLVPTPAFLTRFTFPDLLF